jgi:hypothetical protein
MTAPTPAPATAARRHAEPRTALEARPWQGPTRRYDLLKELVIALVVVGLLTIGLAAVLGSPDESAVTFRQWSSAAPADFVATAASELAGTSGTATYGAPYNNTPDAGQTIGPLQLQKWAGVTIPVDTANDFVIGPLRTGDGGNPATRIALTAWSAASPAQRQKWATAYADALAKAPDGDPTRVAPGSYGPVPQLTASLLGMAQRGGLDGALAVPAGQFFQTDYTRSLLFLADGSYLEDKARAQHLGGDQWGMMNETASYPGQSWLWLYTFWYQIEPFKSSDNADAWVWGLMMLLTLAFVLVPLIPGVRSIPRWIPVHRLIWRDYYRRGA